MINEYNKQNFDTSEVEGFTNYDRLLVELNNREYYDKATYARFLNENGLDGDSQYDRNTDQVKLLETVYAVLRTLLSNIDVYRKIETEFTTQGEAATALQNRLKYLRTEIGRVKGDIESRDSDFTSMYFTC